MDPILPPTGPGTSTGALTSKAAPVNEEAERLLSSDFETFLNMLTAQLENQDPLNPLEATDFAVQLATFSNVEQQVKTNDLLTSFTTQFQTSEVAQLAGWVGMEARAAIPAAFDGRPIQLEALPDATSARAELVIRNASNVEVDRVDIPIQGGPLLFDGTSSSGGLLGAGSYSFEVVSFNADGDLIGTSTPEIYAQVDEIRLDPEGPMVVFRGGEAIPADSVTGVRGPVSFSAS